MRTADQSVRDLAIWPSVASIETGLPRRSLQVQAMWVDCDAHQSLLNPGLPGTSSSLPAHPEGHSMDWQPALSLGIWSRFAAERPGEGRAASADSRSGRLWVWYAMDRSRRVSEGSTLVREKWVRGTGLSLLVGPWVGLRRIPHIRTTPTRRAPDHAAPTACSASTSPRAPTCRDGLPKRSKPVEGPVTHPKVDRPKPHHPKSVQNCGVPETRSTTPCLRGNSPSCGLRHDLDRPVWLDRRLQSHHHITEVCPPIGPVTVQPRKATCS
jgi:hypothetical protein